jgi:bisphosphoglycerate-dependent phosphoglycerate mutase
MSHGRLLKEGKISQREYGELVALKDKANNKAFTKESRREALRMYQEKEKEYDRRGRSSQPQMIRGMERRP